MTAKVYQSFRRFVITLGRLDAAHELTELALREFSASLKGTSDFSEDVAKMANRHGLHVRVDSPSGSFRTVALSGIASAHACYEAFLLEFCSEVGVLRSLEIDLGKTPKGVSKHDYFITCLKKAELYNTSVESDLLNTVVELTRLIRNEQAHKGRTPPKRIEELRTRLCDHTDWTEIFGDRRRPSEFSNIGFEDFLLFTHSVRRMAEFWCQLLLPTCSSIANHPDVVEFISKEGRTKLPQFLRGRFALDPSTSKEVCSLV